MKYFYEFIKYAERENLPFLNFLNPGLNKDEVIEQLGFKNEDLVALYGWRNGVSEKAFGRELNEIWFFNAGFMNPLSTIIDYQKDNDSLQELKGKKMFALFEFGYSEKYFYNYDPLDKDFGKIYYFTLHINFSSTFFVIFDSLDSFFKYVLLAYQKGIWNFSNGHFEVLNSEQDNALLSETNPGTEFFKYQL